VVDPGVVVVVPELVELEPAAFAIAAPQPAMTPSVPSVTRAIRSRFMAFTSFAFGLSGRKDATPKKGLSRF
jgi:hypothetical protein